MNRTHLIMAGIAVVSLAAGGAGGYILAEKRLRDRYDEVTRRDIEAAKEFYKKVYKEEEYESPEKAAEVLLPRSDFASPVSEESPYVAAAVEALQSYSPSKPGEENAPEVTETDVQNVFRNARPTNDVWDYDAEVLSRTPHRPYIISHQEFLEGDRDYEQTTLTYFEGDDCLADSLDEPIRNVEQVVGEENLLKFGHGSDDNAIVYIRNEELEQDFEVLHSKDKFTKAVLGFIEPDEDRRRRPQKLRRGDHE